MERKIIVLKRSHVVPRQPLILISPSETPNVVAATATAVVVDVMMTLSAQCWRSSASVSVTQRLHDGSKRRRRGNEEKEEEGL